MTRTHQTRLSSDKTQCLENAHNHAGPTSTLYDAYSRFLDSEVMDGQHQGDRAEVHPGDKVLCMHCMVTATRSYLIMVNCTTPKTLTPVEIIMDKVLGMHCMVTATRWYLTMANRTTPKTLRYTAREGVSGIGQ